MMRSREELLEIIKEQMAIEYNCSTGDFSGSKNVITTSRIVDGRRQYIKGSYFFKMVTFGENAVITADNRLHQWLEKFVKNKTGYHIFDYMNLLKIDARLKTFNKHLWKTHHLFLSDKKTVPEKIPVKTVWFEQQDIRQFYRNNRFPHALGIAFNPNRPDVLAVAGYDGKKVVALAGCSAETPLLWEIGVDVDIRYRGQGIATGLVTLLKNEIEARFGIPIYSISFSNLYAWRVAIKCGFFPAWIETETYESG
jgi:RimJ/RimL family protein N-acetyltransferase